MVPRLVHEPVQASVIIVEGRLDHSGDLRVLYLFLGVNYLFNFVDDTLEIPCCEGRRHLQILQLSLSLNLLRQTQALAHVYLLVA